MTTMENPVLNLKNLNDLQSRFSANQATINDYEELDFFISSIGGSQEYIKSILQKNGLVDYSQYIKERHENNEGKKVQLARIEGSITGAMSFLKSYVIENKIY